LLFVEEKKKRIKGPPLFSNNIYIYIYMYITYIIRVCFLNRLVSFFLFFSHLSTFSFMCNSLFFIIFPVFLPSFSFLPNNKKKSSSPFFFSFMCIYYIIDRLWLVVYRRIVADCNEFFIVGLLFVSTFLHSIYTIVWIVPQRVRLQSHMTNVQSVYVLMFRNVPWSHNMNNTTYATPFPIPSSPPRRTATRSITEVLKSVLTHQYTSTSYSDIKCTYILVCILVVIVIVVYI